MLAELVDAVVGVDTHRDTHEVEIAHPTGAVIATCQVGNDTSGYAELLAWILDHAPGPGHPQLRRRAHPARSSPPA
jgi:transposase